MTYQRLSNVMYRLMDLENSWKDTNLDLAILKPLYETVDKQAKQAKAQADKALEDLKKLAMLWEDSLKQVKAYVGERGAE
jgi:predicted PilT family ATPase